jgi:hypothetical protein
MTYTSKSKPGAQALLHKAVFKPNNEPTVNYKHFKTVFYLIMIIDILFALIQK